jgi:hypothetical protein
MLDGLERIDWSRLEHAYGSAADVPDQIRALTSADPNQRDRALGELYSNIFHQGTRYEASAYAVPFLLELVRNPERPDRDLLGLLTALAIGYDEAWLPDGFPVAQLREAAQGGEEVLRSAPPLAHGDEPAERRLRYWDSLDPEAEARAYAYIELATYDAVRAGVPAFVDILAQPDASPGDRTGAVYALAWFPEEARLSVPALVRAAAHPEPRWRRTPWSRWVWWVATLRWGRSRRRWTIRARWCGGVRRLRWPGCGGRPRVPGWPRSC